MFIDLRGTGRSNGLNCGMPYPDGIESRFGTLFPLSHVEQCRVALASRADLRHYTTPKSVDDIEALRRWLGYSGVNLYGGSYGTRVAQVYMRRHPDAVRTAVLNGVTPVSEPVYVHAASSIQNALDVLIAECEAKPACHSTHPGFRAAVAALVERIAEGEVEVTLDGRTLPFSAGDLSYALRGLLYQRASEIPDLVDRAANGDLRELASYYLERTAWVRDDFIASGNHFSVLCAEDIERLTDEDVERATDGLWIRDHLVRSYREACAVWPNAELPPSYFRPVASDVPTLLYL